MHWDIQQTQPLKKAFRPGASKLSTTIPSVPHKNLYPAQPKRVQPANVQTRLVQQPKPSALLQPNILSHSSINVSEPTLLVYMAHIWTADIQEAFEAFQRECTKHNIDICVACTSTLKIKVNAPVLYITVEELKQYPGFHQKGLWACNHWILMWVWTFYAKRQGYTRLWSVEYDVRFIGSLAPIFQLDSCIDYVYSKNMAEYTSEAYWGPTHSGWKPKWTALKQLFRVSARFLDYLHEQFLLGHNGQDESTLASHAKEPLPSLLINEPSFSHQAIGPYLSEHWSPHKNDRISKAWHMCKNMDKSELKLFHPIK